MLLKRLKVVDFLSHKETEIFFQKTDRLLIDGPSGAGKSSIVDAIVFALFGVGRVDPKSLIRKSTNGCRVTLEIEDGQGFWTIIRGVTKKGSQSLEIGRETNGAAEPIGATSVKEKQDFIEKTILHSSYDLFANSVLFPQSGTTFVTSTAAGRKDLLMEIIGAAEIDGFGEKVKDVFGLLQTSYAQASSRATTLAGVLESSQKAVTALEEGIKDPVLALQKAQEAAKDVQAQEDAIKALEAQLEPLKASAVKADFCLKEINRLKPLTEIKIDTETDWGLMMKTCEKYLEDLRPLKERFKILNDAKVAVLELKSKIQNNPNFETQKKALEKRLIAAMTEDLSGKKCGKCGEPYAFAVSEKEKRVAELTADLEKLEYAEASRLAFNQQIEDKIAALPVVDQNELSTIQAQLSYEPQHTRDYERAKNNFENTAIALENFEKNTKALHAVLSEYESLQSARDSADRTSSLLNAARILLATRRGIHLEAESAAARARSEAETLARAKETVAKVEQDLAEARGQERKASEELEDLKLLKEAFGANGIKVTVIEHLVPQIEAKMNEVLAELSGFRVRLETQRDSADGKKKVDGLFIDVINEEGEVMDFDSFSGGERVKITIAVSEALASLQRAEFRILDEAFVGLDNESTERFADALTRLQTKYPQMLCVSHLPEVKNLFEDRILVTKKDGISDAKRV